MSTVESERECVCGRALPSGRWGSCNRVTKFSVVRLGKLLRVSDSLLLVCSLSYPFLSFHPLLRLCRTQIPGTHKYRVFVPLPVLSLFTLFSDWHIDAGCTLELSKLLPHLILRGAEMLFGIFNVVLFALEYAPATCY
jgi:hypothetical protein